ncbi:hypothetical protein QL285_079827 [Trifolium repens]|nr:hypothetical protein QL285_079827 [Trifolium repens]
MLMSPLKIEKWTHMYVPVVDYNLESVTLVIRDINGAEINRMILYYYLFRHIKYSPSPSSFPASEKILPSSPFPRIPTVLADINQL